MARAEDAIVDVPDPFEDHDWAGWGRYGRGPGCKWHRVVNDPAGGYAPLCKCRHDPMPESTVLMDYRWDPGLLDRCLRCWPEGVPHPGIISDLPPDRRYR